MIAYQSAVFYPPGCCDCVTTGGVEAGILRAMLSRDTAESELCRIAIYFVLTRLNTVHADAATALGK
jgi:hypothetical protein